MERAEFVERVGPDNILPNVAAALERARWINTSFAGLGDEVAADMRDQSL
jgi:hypothetical protein